MNSTVSIQSVSREDDKDRAVICFDAPPVGGISKGDKVRVTNKDTGAFFPDAEVIAVINATTVHVTGLNDNSIWTPDGETDKDGNVIKTESRFPAASTGVIVRSFDSAE